MTKIIANTVVQTDTWAGLIERVNELATEVRNSVITTANTTDQLFTGANTSGNAVVKGTFVANSFGLNANSGNDAEIFVMQTGHTDFGGDVSGNLIIQSVTTFNQNTHANNITVHIEGNVVSNGTTFDVTTSEDFTVSTSNATFTANVGLAIDTPDMVVTGNNVDLYSTYANIVGTALFVTSNSFIEASNVTISNNNAGTETNILSAALLVDSNSSFTANVSATGANVHVNGTEFKVNSNSIFNSADFTLNATDDLDIDAANVDINGTTGIAIHTPDLLVDGTSANLDSVTTNVTGTDLDVSSNSSFSANVTATGANVYINTTDLTVQANALFNANVTATGANVYINTTDLTVQANALFNANVTMQGANVNIDGDQLTVNSNITIQSNTVNLTANDDIFVNTSNTTISSNVGVTIDTPDFVLTGNNVDLNSTFANIAGETLDVNSNTIFNANVSVDGTHVFFNGTEFKVNSNTVLNGTLVDINANVDIDNSIFDINNTTFNINNTTTDINATNFIVQGTTANITSTTVNITGTTANVDNGQLNISANVYVTGANTTIDSDVVISGNVIIGNNAADLHTVYGSTTFDNNVDINGNLTVDGDVQLGNNSSGSHNVTGNTNFDDSVSIDKQLEVTANVAINTNNLFVDTSTSRVGINTDAPAEELHIQGSEEQEIFIENNSGANTRIQSASQTILLSDTANTVIRGGANATAAQGAVKLQANGSTTAVLTAMLAANGNFGVGNTTPKHKLSVAGTGRFTDDVSLVHDGVVLNFGADSDVKLTHVADTALRINDSRAIQFRDAQLSIGSSDDGQLDIDADVELEIVAPTVDIDASNGVFVSHDLSVGVDASIGQDFYVSRNADVTGTLTVDALSSLDGGIDVNSSKFTVAKTTGDVSTVGSVDIDTNLTVDGTSDLRGNVTYGQQVVNIIETYTHLGDTQEVIEQFNKNTYKSGKIIIQGQDVNGANSEFQVTEVLYVTDGTDVFLTTYGTISTNPDNTDTVFSIDADVSGDNIRIKSTATYGANTKLLIQSTLFKDQS